MKKQWITNAIPKPIEKKNWIYRKCIKTKNATNKEELHNVLKFYRYFLNKIARLSKANHYKTFFEDDKNKLNKVLAGIKEIININKKTPRKLGTLTIMERW